MKIAQYIVIFLLVMGLFWGLWQDFHGKKAREPYGFPGAVCTIVISALLFWCYYSAGAFSLIFAP